VRRRKKEIIVIRSSSPLRFPHWLDTLPPVSSKESFLRENMGLAFTAQMIYPVRSVASHF